MGSRNLTALATAIGFALLGACTGPRPEVTEVSVSEEPGAAGRYLVDVSVRNASGGEGEVKINVRLRDWRTGALYDGGSVSVNLGPRELAHRLVEVRAPDGGRYSAEMEAHYPPT